MQLRRRWKSLLHKVEHLRLEVEDHDELMKEYEVAFLKAVTAAEGSSPFPVPENSKDMVQGSDIDESTDSTEGQQEDSLPDVPEKDLNRPDSMRKLWKAVATATHPDKTGGDEKLTQLYKKASNAWTSGLFEELLEVAMEIGIDLVEPDLELIEAVNHRAKIMSDKVTQIESSVLWMWGSAPEDKKDSILQLYLTMRQKRRQATST